MTQIINVNNCERIETGAVQFKDRGGQCDWTGLYVRGDDAMSIAMAISAIEEHFKEDVSAKHELWYAIYFKSLLDLKQTIMEDVVHK